MLDISERISVIENLLNEDARESLTYAALECRLTLEILCYERFKMYYSYLSVDDLKNWQPRHVVKQVADDIDRNVNRKITVSISTESVGDTPPRTKEDYQAFEYVSLGVQSDLNLNRLHKLWHSLSNVALHIPVPTILSDEIDIYGDVEKIKKKVKLVIEYLTKLDGNLLLGGVIEKSFKFECCMCGLEVRRPISKISTPIVVNCINPDCRESYLLSKKSDEKIEAIRRIIKFNCEACDSDLEIPTNLFKELKFDQQLNIKCGVCDSLLEVIMHPLIKRRKGVK